MSGFVRFESTVWTLLQRAKRQSKAAIEDVMKRYRPPVVAFLRQRGCSAEDAEDLAQEVFLQVVKDGLLMKTDPGRGRFRSFLLAVTQNVLHSELRKRYAAKRTPDEPPPPAVADRDEAFDQAWVWNLVGEALERLRAEHPNQHAALRLQTEEGLDRAAIAARLSMSESDVRNALHRGRVALGQYLQEAIAETCGSREEFDAEIAYLSRFYEKRT